MTRLRLRVSPGAARAEIVGRHGVVSGHTSKDKIEELDGVAAALAERRLTSACRGKDF
jgi:uncharacterized protein YggU (UPF0235/DUF167 family)